jgi:hypothetical protein
MICSAMMVLTLGNANSKEIQNNQGFLKLQSLPKRGTNLTPPEFLISVLCFVLLCDANKPCEKGAKASGITSALLF